MSSCLLEQDALYAPAPEVTHSANDKYWTCSSKPNLVLERIGPNRYILWNNAFTKQKQIGEYFIPDNSLPASAYNILECFRD